jgi:hypothetical protein
MFSVSRKASVHLYRKPSLDVDAPFEKTETYSWGGGEGTDKKRNGVFKYMTTTAFLSESMGRTVAVDITRAEIDPGGQKIWPKIPDQKIDLTLMTAEQPKPARKMLWSFPWPWRVATQQGRIDYVNEQIEKCV